MVGALYLPFNRRYFLNFELLLFLKVVFVWFFLQLCMGQYFTSDRVPIKAM
jgi:hypothetical protein